jgi:maltose phosphorylase
MMKDYILKDEWNIIEKGFKPEYNRISESIFSIGNGRMGQRANFEESYSGDSLQGSYIAGVYYPDKTRVGWWKNGYPEYFAKIVNSLNWIGINVMLDGQEFDLAKCIIHDFERKLDMQQGVLSRSVEFTNAAGNRFRLSSSRFISLNDLDAAVVKYSITPVSSSATIEYEPYLDGDITNEDANYDERFWFEVAQNAIDDTSSLCMETYKTGFQVCTAMKPIATLNGNQIASGKNISLAGFVSRKYTAEVAQGEEFTITKYVATEVSLYHNKEELPALARLRVDEIAAKGFAQLHREHADKWSQKWLESDIIIEGDIAAQQAIRYNIFQLYQTYTGDDARLNIGPKGFTGEKYGGVTYWDTEAYCLPFYLRTANPQVAKNLLMYRYNHLPKAIENAGKLGFKDGAALYPMVTINGEECHNEWEITFEEIHRNGAIAYAIYNYVNYTGDEAVIEEFALEVLIAISRFWAQRVSWSANKNAYVILGVTGPNEYENNVSNNWYTNTIAKWTLEFTMTQIKHLKDRNKHRLGEIFKKTAFDEKENFLLWQDIVEKIYSPYDKSQNIFLQQDGFLDKELIPVQDLPDSERPIHAKWSWDRILRSCYIKQADVLQGLYMFEDQYDQQTITRNFNFYEPFTVHESSLSASIHCILANKIGNKNKAYEMYLRTARLDLDDYNSDTKDGLHTTSMGGTWMSIVEGFAGLRVKDGILKLKPSLPEEWESFSFSIIFRKALLKILVNEQATVIENKSDYDIEVSFGDDHLQVAGRSRVEYNGRQQHLAV